MLQQEGGREAGIGERIYDDRTVVGGGGGGESEGGERREEQGWRSRVFEDKFKI